MNWRRLHLGLTLLWVMMIAPTLLWWRDSILWVAFMSLYANVVGHWSAYQASRAEDALGTNGGSSSVELDLDELYSKIMGIYPS